MCPAEILFIHLIWYVGECYSFKSPSAPLRALTSVSEQQRDVGRRTPSEAPGPVFVLLPEFQTSPLDHQTENQTAPNGLDLSAPQRDLFQPLPSNLEMETQRTAADFHSVSLNSPDFFKLASAAAENSPKSAVRFKDGGVGSSNPFDAPPSTFADPFTSPSGEDGLFLSPHLVVTNPFHKAAAASEAAKDPPIKDLFSASLLTPEDTSSPLSARTPELLSRTVTRDLLQDLSGSEEPSSYALSHNPFTAVPNGTPAVFKPPPEDLPSRSQPTLSTPPESSDVGELPKVVLATPKGSKVEILQATPFVQARSLSASSDQSSPELARVRTLGGIWSPKNTVVLTCKC